MSLDKPKCGNCWNDCNAYVFLNGGRLPLCAKCFEKYNNMNNEGSIMTDKPQYCRIQEMVIPENPIKIPPPKNYREWVENVTSIPDAIIEEFIDANSWACEYCDTRNKAERCIECKAPRYGPACEKDQSK